MTNQNALGDLMITPNLSIPRGELQYRFTRSGGPGGQHVNRTATQVELTFDVLHSPSLHDEQRARLIKALRRRIDGDGVMHLASHSTRSQFENREDVTERFVTLLASAVTPVKRRNATAPTRTSKEKRLEAKKKRAVVKRQRQTSPDVRV